MPPIRTIKNRKKLIEQEGLKENAIRDLKSSKIESGRKAAKIYDLAPSSLQDRLNGRRPVAEINALKRKLTANEEETLIKRVLSLAKRGYPPRPIFIENWANLLLANRGSSRPTKRVGINWKSTFINRHPELKGVYSRAFNHQRAKCEYPKIIRPWFELVRTTIAEYGINSSDIYNFDETGFAMGLIQRAKVIIGAETTNKEAFVLQPGKREWVTAIETINSTGWHLPPYIIFKGTHKRVAWFEDDPTVRFQCSDNGWTTDKITLDWLQRHFIPLTRTRTVGRYRLLILDGHGSHLTPEFDTACLENDIISICMPAHSSHLCQPLDVSIFSPLKKSYYKHIEYRSRLGFSHIDKLDFLEAFLKARTEAYKSTSIQNGFAAAGLIPIDPERVLAKLNVQLKTPTPPGSSHGTSQSSCHQTPSNLHEMKRYSTSIKQQLNPLFSSPSNPTIVKLDRMHKGYEIATHNATLLAQENMDLRAEIQKYNQKCKRTKKAVIEKASLIGGEAQSLIDESNAANQLAADLASMEDELPRRRAPPTCSNCNIIGHNRRRCPNRTI